MLLHEESPFGGMIIHGALQRVKIARILGHELAESLSVVPGVNARVAEHSVGVFRPSQSGLGIQYHRVHGKGATVCLVKWNLSLLRPGGNCGQEKKAEREKSEAANVHENLRTVRCALLAMAERVST